MAKSSPRLQLRPKTYIEELVFDRLKQGSDNVSAKGTRAIATHYLAETVSQLDPKLEDPELRLAVIESMHELEARLNLIKSLFPDLAPVVPPSQPVWLPPNSLNGQVQPEPRPNLEVVPEPGPAKPEKSQARQDDAEDDGESDEAPSSGGGIDPFEMSWSDFNTGEKESR